MMKSAELEAKHLRWIEACTCKRDVERVMYDISNDPEIPASDTRRKLSRADCKMLVNKLWQITGEEVKREQAERQHTLWGIAANWAKSLVRP